MPDELLSTEVSFLEEEPSICSKASSDWSRIISNLSGVG